MPVVRPQLLTRPTDQVLQTGKRCKKAHVSAERLLHARFCLLHPVGELPEQRLLLAAVGDAVRLLEAIPELRPDGHQLDLLIIPVRVLHDSGGPFMAAGRLGNPSSTLASCYMRVLQAPARTAGRCMDDFARPLKYEG